VRDLQGVCELIKANNNWILLWLSATEIAYVLFFMYLQFFLFALVLFSLSKVYIFKTLSANITTDHQKCTFFKHHVFNCVSIKYPFQNTK